MFLQSLVTALDMSAGTFALLQFSINFVCRLISIVEDFGVLLIIKRNGSPVRCSWAQESVGHFSGSLLKIMVITMYIQYMHVYNANYTII